jgi:hypothetical protein
MNVGEQKNFSQVNDTVDIQEDNLDQLIEEEAMKEVRRLHQSVCQRGYWPESQ